MEIPIEFAGRTLSLDNQEGTDLVAKSMQEGHYEAPLPMLVLAIMSRLGGVFCDVGANNGLYTVLACKAIPEVTAIAFEPYPPVISVLKRNIAINGLVERVTIHELALSDKDGSAPLFLPDASHGLLETSCSLESDFKPRQSVEPLSIQTKRMDAIDLPSRISLIKVDIEGHEAKFLRGAKATLKTHRPIVAAEMLPFAEPEFASIDDIFKELRYECFRLRADMVIRTRNIFHDPKAWNYAFVPEEHLKVFEACCSTHHLEMMSEYR